MKLTLKAARVNVDMTIKQVAEKIGKNEMTVSNWENGKTQPKLADLQNLARLYQVDIDDFKFNSR